MHFTRQRRSGNQRIKCPLGQPQMSVGGVMQYQPGRVPQGEYRLAVSWRRSAGDVIQEMAQPSRRLGKRVGCKPSRIRIPHPPHPPPASDQALCGTKKTRAPGPVGARNGGIGPYGLRR